MFTVSPITFYKCRQKTGVPSTFFIIFNCILDIFTIFAIDFLNRNLIGRCATPVRQPNSKGSIEVHAVLKQAVVTSNVEAGIGWEITTYWKGVYLTLVFGYTNLANSNSSEESNGRCPRDVILASLYWHIFMPQKREEICLIGGVPSHIGVGSDVVHSLELGNARALCSGMNNR